MISTKDLAWAAGLLEGEGYFACHRGSPYVSVEMTDEDVVQKFASLFPKERAGVPTQRPNAYHCRPGCNMHHHKDSWRQVLSGRRAAALMMTLYVFLGDRRQSKIREVLKDWREKPYYECPGGDHHQMKPGGRRRV